MRWVPLAVATVVGLLAGVLPIVRYRLRYGKSPVGSIGPMRWSARLVALTLFLQVALWTEKPSLEIARALVDPWPRTGLVVIAIGLLLVMRGQWEMGASWRIGVEAAARPGLITTGLFTVTRNPIYLGIFVISLGYLLALPTIASITLIVIGCLEVREIVKHEERYLIATYGGEYRTYATRVGRFLPGVGRLTSD